MVQAMAAIRVDARIVPLLGMEKRVAGMKVAPKDNITGRTYLENDKPVVVLVRWNGTPAVPWDGIPLVWHLRLDGKPHSRTGPHNVLIERTDGSQVVRGFRGLHRLSAPPP